MPALLATHAPGNSEPSAKQFAEVLERLQSHAPEWLGIPVTGVMPAPVRDRMNSCSASVRVTADGRTLPLFVKVYKRSSKMFDPRRTFDMHLISPEARTQREFAAMQRLYEGLKPYTDFRVPRPVACFPDLLALAMEEAQGAPLHALIERQGRLYPTPRALAQLEECCRACGKWLALFQQLTREAGGRFDPMTMIPYVDVRMRRLVSLPSVPFDAALRRRVLDYFERQIPCVADEDLSLVAVHGDFAPMNMLVDEEGRVTVLDFASLDVGARYHDLCYLYQRLAMMSNKPLYRPATMRRLQRALLEGYGADVSSRPLFRLFQIQHILTNFVSVSRREELPLPLLKRLFDRWIYRIYVRWLCELVAE